MPKKMNYSLSMTVWNKWFEGRHHVAQKKQWQKTVEAKQATGKATSNNILQKLYLLKKISKNRNLSSWYEFQSVSWTLRQLCRCQTGHGELPVTAWQITLPRDWPQFDWNHVAFRGTPLAKALGARERTSSKYRMKDMKVWNAQHECWDIEESQHTLKFLVGKMEHDFGTRGSLFEKGHSWINPLVMFRLVAYLRGLGRNLLQVAQGSASWCLLWMFCHVSFGYWSLE